MRTILSIVLYAFINRRMMYRQRSSGRANIHAGWKVIWESGLGVGRPAATAAICGNGRTEDCMRKWALRLRKGPKERKKMMSDKPDTAATKGNPAPAAKPAPAATGQSATIRYIDRPDIEEIFADSVSGLIFDGQTLRIEFAVTRLDELKANTPLTGRRYPAGRIVLPPAAAVDLINRMQQIAAALRQAGVVKAAARPGEAPKAD